jgi:hypothetical protein
MNGQSVNTGTAQPVNTGTANPINSETAQPLVAYGQIPTPVVPGLGITDEKTPPGVVLVAIIGSVTTLAVAVLAMFGPTAPAPLVSCSDEVSKVLKLHSEYPTLEPNYDNEIGVECHLNEAVRQVSVPLPAPKTP